MKRIAIPLVLFLGLAGGVGYLATRGGGPAASTAAGGGSLVAPDGLTSPAGAPQEMTRKDAVALSPPVGSASDLPAIGLDIVKTADVSVVVKKDGFTGAFSQASVIAEGYGGYVESSSTQGSTSRSGFLTIRVPSSSFESAMHDLTALGVRVEHQSISGQDVTGQFVDLEARLRTWEAQERVLLRLMSKAHSVNATLQVQNQLQDVQFQIEQIKGELSVLRNQTSLATIQLALREPGIAPGPTPQPNRPSLVEAWSRGLDGTLAVLYTVVVGLGYLVPIALLSGLAWLGWRRIRTRAVGQPVT